MRRFKAPEANQAVAVDAAHFYAIGNHVVGKYEKRTGERVALWQCEAGKPLNHLNSGVVREGVLYCAHSNYPGVPMVSSIETWETKTLRHSGSHSFGIFAGSATWIDFRAGHRYVTFAHYGNRAAEPNRDPRWTTLIQFDAEWRQVQGWVYPEEVIAKLGQYSISGGVFAGDGKLFCTGHDNPEIYVLRFPEGGSTLALEETFAVPNQGQGIAMDASELGTLYAIDRAKGEVIVIRVRRT
jgi:outer membrane protein assembly factor BamB